MSNRQPEENENLLKSIAATVEMIRDRMVTRDEVESLVSNLVTKDEVESLVSNLVTKDEAESLVSKLVTKEEFEPVREQVGFLGGQVEYIRDRMDTLATKDELDNVEARLNQKIEVETTTIRGDIEQVHLRLDGIEKAISSRIGHVEAEMSRMRSVLYLLVKDRPEMLRLLGQPPPAGVISE